ncbi:hypothetical protein [Acidisphaera sp. L21]|jgi:hypothetical protein|uniref:hypothetical protein n=1 Tax=Acidisphaera sp. L21 TaxID=1641851 RepID=UPI0015757F28|nr:hypothetical protein [Acidisphaera sp. L21]
MTNTPAHDWMLPKLIGLLAEAEKVGIAQQIAVAVLTDLLEGPAFNQSELEPGPAA